MPLAVPRRAAPLLIFAIHSAYAPSLRSNMALLDQLLQSPYDASMRPSLAISGETCGAPDEVETEFYVVKLYNIDEKSKTFDIDGFLRLRWVDWRLRHNNSCGAIKITHSCTKTPCNGDALRLWTPVLYMENALANSVGGVVDGSTFQINPDGSIFFSQRARVTYDCSFRFGRLPFDTQYCRTSLGPYSDNSSEVLMRWGAGGFNIGNNDHSGEFTVTAVGWATVDHRFSTGNFSAAEACLTLRRESTLYLSVIQINVLLLLSAYTGFFVSPAAAPARVALTFLCTLITLNNMNSVHLRLPAMRSAERVWIADFLLFTSFFIFFALIEYALVNFGMQLEQWTRDEESTAVHDFELEADRRASTVCAPVIVPRPSIATRANVADSEAQTPRLAAHVNTTIASLASAARASIRSSDVDTVQGRELGARAAEITAESRPTPPPSPPPAAGNDKAVTLQQVEAAVEAEMSSTSSFHVPAIISQMSSEAMFAAGEQVTEATRTVLRQGLRRTLWTVRQTKKLDHICRYMFLVIYGMFCVIMWSLLNSNIYPEAPSCHWQSDSSPSAVYRTVNSEN